MKIIACLLACRGYCTLSAAVPPAIRPEAKIEAQIEKTLEWLTTEEKIGQICQLTISTVIDPNHPERPLVSETPGNMDDLNLPAEQKRLVRALAATGKPLVLVLNEGRPRLIGNIEPLAQAVVDILLPGNYGGDALANLLAGDANFSARLPFTYPRWPDALATYDYKPSQKMGTMEGEYNYDAVMDVQWPFGHGLSYTTFAYGNLRAATTEFEAEDTLSFSVDVTNTGDRAGMEAVQM